VFDDLIEGYRFDDLIEGYMFDDLIEGYRFDELTGGLIFKFIETRIQHTEQIFQYCE
jgi:hypothetical protein